MSAIEGARTRARRRRAGFTLVELMVAVTGGLFVSLAVFVLAKHSTSFYQSEARAGNATFGTIIGFDRLRADITRAGYLASPNVRTDPSLCGDPVGGTGWPSRLSRLSSVFIRRLDTAEIPTVLRDNGRTPDEITLAGSYTSNDQFETASIFATGGGHTVNLRPNSPAMGRLGYASTTDTAAQASLLSSVFATGRVLRIVDKTGTEQYGTITGTAGGERPTISLALNAPALQYRSGSAARCGINDLGVGALANVVNFIRYGLRVVPVTNVRFRRAVQGDPIATDAGRTELIRVEVGPDDVEYPETEEVVTEFAVDLSFGITVATVVNTTGGRLNQTNLMTFAAGTNGVTAWAGDPTARPPNQGPQRIRSVRARLSVRSREGDRLTGIPASADIADGFYRIGLGAGGVAPFARVRTVQADIALRNQLGVMWQ